ncbi:MAG: PD-(D/E)XK nuclease family protein [Magnetococcus sp. YQC-5]
MNVTILSDKACKGEVGMVTVNRRLARFLVREFDAAQLASGRMAWKAPDILPWSAWMERSWDALHDQWQTGAGHKEVPLLLTSAQELLLWERMVGDSPEGAGLLRLPDAARKARDAWNLLRAWEVDLDVEEAAQSEDSAAWRRWADRFEAELTRNHWVVVAELPTFLQRHSHKLVLPEQIHLAGFDRFTPQQESLWQALRARGVDVEPVGTGRMSGKAVRCDFPDQEAEIRAAAIWSRNRLLKRLEMQTDIGSSWPSAVVIPGLAAMRAKVVRIFQEIFQSGKPDEDGSWELFPFNLSLGVPLTETPPVRDALLLLELGLGELDTASYGRLLATPFMLGGEQEWSARGVLDARLRADGCLSLSVEQLLLAAKGGRQTPSCPLLAEALTRFLVQWHKPKREELKATTRQWAERFAQWLRELGWPGERVPDSTEYQAVASWRESLMAFAALDRVGGKMGLRAALALLRRHLAETLFQPETFDAPIQILGMLEAVGERFDGLWILGLSEDVWPPVPEPNPFLPVSFQRRKGFPKCSGEQELLFAKQILEGLFWSADEVIVSHTRQDGDREWRASPLVMHLPWVAWPSDEPFSTGVQIMHEPMRWEVLDDWHVTPFGEGVEVAGGAGVIKSQALCPFQAFARYRLAASSLDNPQPGLDGARRGELVHWMMNTFWTRIQTREALTRLSSSQWDELATEVVAGTVEEAIRRWPDALSKAGKRLEQERLLRLLSRWSDLEESRDQDFEVIRTEATSEIEMAGVRLTLRMDRVDRLQDERLVILDYKTGKIPPRIRNWFEERPTEPQLPLYCLTLEDQTVALAFARVLSYDVRFIGLAREEGILPEVTAFDAIPEIEVPDWTALLKHWRRVFNGLARAFRGGVALPDPLPGACVECDLEALCRMGDVNGTVP